MGIPVISNRTTAQVAEIGSRLTEPLSLPHSKHDRSAADPAPDRSGPSHLQLSFAPEMRQLVPVVNTLGSLEVMTCLQRLSNDELRQLHALGSSHRRHAARFSADEAQLVERVAEALFLTQSKSITTLNIVGPERWRGVLKTPDAVVGVTYHSLDEERRALARANVLHMAHALATLPEEGINLLNDFRSLRPGVASWVDPLYCLHDRILKRAIHCNYDAWQLRKGLEQTSHRNATMPLENNPAPDRLFAALMGLSTFQMLREAGHDSCKTLLNVGNELLNRNLLAAANLQHAVHNNELMTRVENPNGASVDMGPDLMRHLARNHHELWLANRTLCSLLPAELHQPERSEHRAFDELPRHVQNLSCLHVLCLATSLAEAEHSSQKAQLVTDLLRNAAPGNPFGLSL
jgi:hypothetical protein